MLIRDKMFRIIGRGRSPKESIATCVSHQNESIPSIFCAAVSMQKFTSEGRVR